MFPVQLLSEHTHPVPDAEKWPVIGQFSSIGSMGLDKTKWLSAEFQRTLTTLGKIGKSLNVPETPLLLVSVSEDLANEGAIDGAVPDFYLS